MSKISLNTITSGFSSITALNNNFSTLSNEMQDKVLYRNNPNGEPNEMYNDLDMNGYRILNLGNTTALASASVSQVILWGAQRDGTGTHSLSIGDIYRTIEVSISSSNTAVLSLSTESQAGWVGGQWLSIIQLGVGRTKISPEVGVTLRYPSSAYIGTSKQYENITLKYRGADIWYLVTDLSA